MNVYIYGNQSFKKEIHETLEHANIKFKLDDDSIIEEIDSLDILKKRIIENPSDIYLIDEAKIIKKNILNQKMKFLTSKDSIDEEFLFENGVADLSVDSLSEIPKYILKKHESMKTEDSNIQESIIDIVDEAYSEDLASIYIDDEIEKIELDEELELLLSSSSSDDNDTSNNLEFEENVGLSNISSDYDDTDSLDDLLKSNSSDDFDIDIQKNSNLEFEDDVGLEENYLIPNGLEEIDEFEENDIQEMSLEDEFASELGLDIENNVSEENIENIDISNEIEGKNMIDDEFSQLDSLNKEDILDALNNMDDIEIKPVVKQETKVKEEKISVEGSNVNDIAELISKLLNNKTLEITIKIKD